MIYRMRHSTSLIVTSCYKIVDATFQDPSNSYIGVSISKKLCSTGELTEHDLEDGVTTVINECVDVNELIKIQWHSEDAEYDEITETQIIDAIDNNSGVLVVGIAEPGTDPAVLIGVVTFTFDYCD